MGGLCGDCGGVFGSVKTVVGGCFFCEGPKAVVFLFLSVLIGFDAGYVMSSRYMIERSQEKSR